MKTTWLASLVLVAACTVGEDPDVPDGTFAITTQTPTVLEGSYGDAQATVSFRAIEVAPRRVEVTLRIDDTEVTTRVDHATGEVVLQGQDAQLTEHQIAVMGPLSQVLGARLPGEDERSLVEDALVRNVLFIGVAPAATSLGEIKAVSENGWSYLPCARRRSYLAPNTWRTTGRGGACEGRCGIGCGPDNRSGPWGTGKYTYDCARHDYGLGSWNAAFDDYTFAFPNCR
jgi:hypothetical protein